MFKRPETDEKGAWGWGGGGWTKEGKIWYDRSKEGNKKKWSGVGYRGRGRRHKRRGRGIPHFGPQYSTSVSVYKQRIWEV